MNKLFNAIKEKAKGNYVSSDVYTIEERFNDMVTINNRLQCNMSRSIELQKELNTLEPKKIFHYHNKLRAELKTLNNQIRRDTLLLEKLLYIS